MKHYPTVLSIAGSDSCGGAGIQADLKTFSALGVYGTTAITAITAQNTLGVRSVQPVTPQILRDQIEAVLDDMKVDAVKIGMLHSRPLVEVVIQAIQKYRPENIVLDPVMISTSGHPLLDEETISVIVSDLFPLVDLITPNRNEAEWLTGVQLNDWSDAEKSAALFMQKGCKAILIKGGHFEGAIKQDMLFVSEGENKYSFAAPEVITRNSHGTGCTLSSAIAAYMAMRSELPRAVKEAKIYLTEALKKRCRCQDRRRYWFFKSFFCTLSSVESRGVELYRGYFF